MNICQEHWDKLREEVKKAGLWDLVAPDGETAIAQLVDNFETEERTKVNFDPLMGAYFAIGSNAMEMIGNAGGNPLYLMTEGEEDKVIGYPGYEDRTWPKCGICYLNLLHEITCTGCALPKIGAFEYFIERSVEDQVKAWEELKAEE